MIVRTAALASAPEMPDTGEAFVAPDPGQDTAVGCKRLDNTVSCPRAFSVRLGTGIPMPLLQLNNCTRIALLRSVEVPGLTRNCSRSLSSSIRLRVGRHHPVDVLQWSTRSPLFQRLYRPEGRAPAEETLAKAPTTIFGSSPDSGFAAGRVICTGKPTSPVGAPVPRPNRLRAAGLARCPPLRPRARL